MDAAVGVVVLSGWKRVTFRVCDWLPGLRGVKRCRVFQIDSENRMAVGVAFEASSCLRCLWMFRRDVSRSLLPCFPR